MSNTLFLDLLKTRRGGWTRPASCVYAPALALLCTACASLKPHPRNRDARARAEMAAPVLLLQLTCGCAGLVCGALGESREAFADKRPPLAEALPLLPCTRACGQSTRSCGQAQGERAAKAGMHVQSCGHSAGSSTPRSRYPCCGVPQVGCAALCLRACKSRQHCA